KQHLFLGILVGVSIMATLTVATLAGSLIPIFMDKVNIDPAVASGPFITTINDIISVLIYFGMATAFMRFLIYFNKDHLENMLSGLYILGMIFFMIGVYFLLIIENTF